MADCYRSQCEKETRREKNTRAGIRKHYIQQDGLARSENISTVKNELLSLIHAAYLSLGSLELAIVQLLRLSYDGFPGRHLGVGYLSASVLG